MEIPGQDKSEKNYLETLPYQGEGKANKQTKKKSQPAMKKIIHRLQLKKKKLK